MLQLRTSLNYKRRSSYYCRYVNHQDVIEIDTSVETAMKNSNADTETSVKGEFLNNDVPVEVFGRSVLMTEYDPLASKRRSAARASEAQHSQADSSANNVQQNVQTSAAATAAADKLD